MNGFYWIYLVMLGFLVGYSLANTKEQRRSIYYASVVFLLIIFIAQDFSVSIDIAEYMRQYAIIPTLTFGQMLTHKFEIGYVLLCRLLEMTFESDRVLLLAMGVLILLPFGRFYDRESSQPMVALMAFVALGMYMHAIIFWRQLAAMAILTFAIPYIRQRKLLPFLLILLAAMSFHKTAVVFLWIYLIYKIPIGKMLLLGCAVLAVILGFFGNDIIDLGIALLYPKYVLFPRLVIGGYTLLALLWVVTLLSYWVFRQRMDDPRVRIPFLMILTAATIQPVCFAFYNWLRIVLYFRVALAAITAELFVELFQNKENVVLALVNKVSPKLHGQIVKLYDTKWFSLAMQLVLFAVLFVWYVSELDGAVYRMAPIVTEPIVP